MHVSDACLPDDVTLTNVCVSTPWLTTRRRTCPICKGDVVRSMTHSQGDESRNQNEDSNSAQESGTRTDFFSRPVLISSMNEDDASDTEQAAGLLDGHANSAPPSNWRSFASFSLSALSGDTIWHQVRADRDR